MPETDDSFENPTEPQTLARLESRLQRLEEFYLHQQRWIQTLDQVLVELRADLERLEKRLEITHSRIEWSIEMRDRGDDLPHEKPPHY